MTFRSFTILTIKIRKNCIAEFQKQKTNAKSNINSKAKLLFKKQKLM